VFPTGSLPRDPSPNQVVPESTFADHEVAFVRSVGTVLESAAVRLRLRLRLENEIRRAALRDALTGLPNRRALLDDLEEILTSPRPAAEVPAAAVLFVDLDGFKAVKDSIGHEAGDQLLREIANRLLGSVRAGHDIVGRLGGDEFAIICPGSSAGHALSLAERVITVVSAPDDRGPVGRGVRVDRGFGVAERSAGGRRRSAERGGHRDVHREAAGVRPGAAVPGGDARHGARQAVSGRRPGPRGRRQPGGPGLPGLGGVLRTPAGPGHHRGGVATAAQLDTVAAAGCDWVIGPVYGPAQPTPQRAAAQVHGARATAVDHAGRGRTGIPRS
jgi:diguanylate cyclase (GGDEF)-like protein